MEPNEEPNWTELLEKEWMQIYPDIVAGMRADGHSDKEIFEELEAWG